MQARLQKPDEGIRVLNEIHSMVRKAFPYSRYLFHNIIWTAIAKNNISAAGVIASSPQCNEKDLRLLKEGFPPLLKYEHPFSNMFISEYLFAMNSFDQISDYENCLEALFTDIDKAEVEKSIALKAFSMALDLLVYKKNKIFSDIKLYFDYLINNSTIYSEFAVAEQYLEAYCKRPGLTSSAEWRFQWVVLAFKLITEG